MPRERELPPDDEYRTEVTEVREEGPPPDEPPPGGPWWRENWWVPLLLLLLLVLGAIGLLFYLQQDDDEDEATTVAVSTVPEVVGLEEEQAVSTLRRAGYEADVERVESDEPGDRVVEQIPEPGTELVEGGTVRLLVSRGPPETVTQTETETETEETPTETQTETETVTEEPEEPQPVTVPDVVGAGHADAGSTLEQAGLIADSYPVPSDEPRGVVVAVNPDAGTELMQGQRVRLNVSLGPEDDERPAAEVPDVTGDEERVARRKLRNANFTVRTLDRDAPEPDTVGRVILQRPEPSSAPVLTQVTIYVGRE